MKQDVFHSDYWILQHEVHQALVVVIRTAKPYDSIADIGPAFDALERVMNRLDRASLSLLVDLRLSVGRNDPEFERATFSQPHRLAQSFVRSAVVIKTAAGMLQIQRQIRERALNMRVFDSEAEALSYLQIGPPGSSAAHPTRRTGRTHVT